MRAVCRAWKRKWIVAGCLAMLLGVSYAQKRPGASSPQTPREILVGQAHALEARGRPDMAIQLWQQILLSDPNNTEALAGLARDLRLVGNTEKSNQALDRLRKINPNDPDIPKIEALTSTRNEAQQLRHAGDLARQGNIEGAMQVYRQLYGDHPPDGDIALAYYQTLYGTANGKQAAIAGMRALAERNPGDPRYIIQLGIMLTYDPRTRAEGIRLLQGHQTDLNAQTALRQALIWDASNPASVDELRQYVKEHPGDAEMARYLKEDEGKLAQMNSGMARTPAERAAFAALNAHKLDEAEARFTAILKEEPGNGRAAAGMGFLRMQQGNFGGAVSYLSQAEQNGFKDRSVEDALATSRFWYTMGEATQAFNANQMDLAEAKFRAALEMRPSSPEALNGLAGLLLKGQQYSRSAQVYEQLVKVQPENPDGWRGLFLAYAQDAQNDKALAASARFPTAVAAALQKEPQYLRALAEIYQAENRTADAQRVLALALALPFPNHGASLTADTQLQYAGILMDAERYDQAVSLYRQILSVDPGNLSAWMGMVSAHHALGQDEQAIADVRKMPTAAYESAIADPGFLALLGSIYQQANQFTIAQGLLERAVKLQTAAGKQPGIALELQLAALYLQANDTTQAYALYHQILAAHPDRADAWKGLISTLLATSRNQQALQEIALIPAPVRQNLESDIDFLQTEASLYAATDDIPRATAYMSRVEAYYAKLNTPPPPSIAIQDAWLLFNTQNDRALYSALMRLGGRSDLTAAQRETVEDIWANWSVRRAGQAMDNGNAGNAIEILDAASQAFPNNMTVRKAVAGGYVRAGRAKESLALFKTVPMQDASASDFQGAIGAALAANDMNQAETWLREALARYAKDPAILGLAARFEQARGDNQRAAAYWRASLAAMPNSSATDKLAHDLDYPEQDTKARRAVTPADLQRLLNPNDKPFDKTTKLPPLPAYGPDPYNGSAPVVVAPSQPAQPPTPQNPPAANPPGSRLKLPPAPGASDPDRRAAFALEGAITPQERGLFDVHAASQRAALRPAVLVTRAGIRNYSDFDRTPRLLLAQYTPSAQEAASGAYSSPKKQATPAQQSQTAQPQAAPAQQPAAPAKKRKRRRKASPTRAPAVPPAPAQTASPTPTLGNTPAAPNPAQGPVSSPATTPAQSTVPSEPPPQSPPAASGGGLTDEELEQRNLPPLRGPWVRVQRQPRRVSPREEAEEQLHAIESGYSGWFGGSGLLNNRSGALGFDHLSALEAPFEASAPLGYNARFTVIARPVFLDSGQANGTATMTVQGSTSPGAALVLVSIPQPLGSLMATNTAPPAQQNAAGIAGEAQLAFPHLSIAGGYTPAGFLVATFTARAYWRPANGPFTFTFVRDSQKDSQLSYSGLRDPAGNSLDTAGQIWGGVVYNQANVQFSRGDAQSGYYFSAGGQYLSGYNVETNTRVDGDGGAYWRAITLPEYGNLSIGANFFGMHYANNQNAFTFGMGGYFSPQVYFLANIPLTWTGHYLTHWHYVIMGGMGVQAFEEDETPLFPLASSDLESTETATVGTTTYSNLQLPALTSVGPNYDLRGQAAYQIGPHWFAGGYFSANNTRNYQAASVGFYVRYMFRSQPSTATTPTGIFPTDGLRPFTVP